MVPIGDREPPTSGVDDGEDQAARLAKLEQQVAGLLEREERRERLVRELTSRLKRVLDVASDDLEDLLAG